MQEIHLKQELYNILKTNKEKITSDDLPILKELYRIVNDCTDKNGCKHDDLGRFAKKEGNKIATTQEEKEQKINSVNIDFTKDNILPELNKEEQELLGAGNKKVRIKKSILDRNKKHDDVNKGDDNYIIASGLYNPEMVLPAKSDNYFHFISHVGDDKNSIVLLDIVSEGEYLDVVHYYYTKDKGVRRIKKNR